MVKSKLINIALEKLNKVIDEKVQAIDQNEQELRRTEEKQIRNKMLLSGKYSFFENFKNEI